MILNQDFDFDRDAPENYKRAFVFPPHKVLLRTGEKLFRIMTPVEMSDLKKQASGQNARSDQNEVGQWWMTEQIFSHLVGLSKEEGKNLSNVVREKLAIPKDFSPRMNALCIIRLKRDMYAFQGLASPQHFISTDEHSMMLPGKTEQVWIPRMSWKDVYLERFLDSFQSVRAADLSPHLTVPLGAFWRTKKDV